MGVQVLLEVVEDLFNIGRISTVIGETMVITIIQDLILTLGIGFMVSVTLMVQVASMDLLAIKKGLMVVPAIFQVEVDLTKEAVGMAIKTTNMAYL